MPTPRSARNPRPPWLALIHQLPPSPAYLRVKVRRRLHGLGAYALKQTVYVLPNSDEALEDFQWLREEIEAGGGSAVIAQLEFLDGISNEEINANLPRQLSAHDRKEAIRGADRVKPGRTWVTRAGVFVDRIASAWLIRRFIDPKARFKFVAGRGYVPRPSELRFDMTQAEYSHVGDACTFQTLLNRFGIADPALIIIGQIVHDIDCKDDAFNRPEKAGIHGLMRGIARRPDDHDRLTRGGAVLDDLYANLRRL